MALTGPSTQKAHMDKKYLLAQMRLLSALESWSFTAGQRLPDYLLDDLNRMTGLIEVEILKEPTA